MYSSKITALSVFVFCLFTLGQAVPVDDTFSLSIREDSSSLVARGWLDKLFHRDHHKDPALKNITAQADCLLLDIFKHTEEELHKAKDRMKAAEKQRMEEKHNKKKEHEHEHKDKKHEEDKKKHEEDKKKHEEDKKKHEEDKDKKKHEEEEKEKKDKKKHEEEEKEKKDKKKPEDKKEKRKHKKDARKEKKRYKKEIEQFERLAKEICGEVKKLKERLAKSGGEQQCKAFVATPTSSHPSPTSSSHHPSADLRFFAD